MKNPKLQTNVTCNNNTNFKWPQPQLVKNKKSGESGLSIPKWIGKLNSKPSMSSITLFYIDQMNSKLLNKSKSIWIKNFMEAGMLLLAEILDQMSRINKAPFCKLRKVLFRL